MRINHYTYRLTAINQIDCRRYYIGVRSCDCSPDKDDYMSSSRHVADAISAGVKFNKQILAVFDNPRDAQLHEVELHRMFDVSKNREFFNVARAKGVGFPVVNQPRTTETKAKMSKTLLVVLNSPEVRARRRLAASNPEFRAKLSKAHLGKPKSASQKAAMKLAQNTPERKLSKSLAFKTALAKKEVIDRRTASLKRSYECRRAFAKMTGATVMTIDKLAYRQWLAQQEEVK